MTADTDFRGYRASLQALDALKLDGIFPGMACGLRSTRPIMSQRSQSGLAASGQT